MFALWGLDSLGFRGSSFLSEETDEAKKIISSVPMLMMRHGNLEDLMLTGSEIAVGPEKVSVQENESRKNPKHSIVVYT